MPTPPPNPISHLNEARQDHRRVRSEMRMALEAEVVEPLDVLTLSVTPEGVPLRSLRVDELLAYQPHWTHRMVATALERLHNTKALPSGITNRRLRVRVLIDGRCYGSRVVALADAMSTVERPLPAARFPFTHVENE